jgi:hypothetical protein
MIRSGYLLVLLLLLTGCNADPPPGNKLLGCADCHELQHDEHHRQDCISCHKGRTAAKDKEEAHQTLVARPAHPDTMAETCGPCHQEMVDALPESLHFTLKNSVNLFRQAFGAENDLENFYETPLSPAPETGLELADDLLRRRCFRCHLFDGGDGYPATRHGTGCAACHLRFEDGEAAAHSFSSPADTQCLSCHYGNYVGFDYYGRFEHDFNNEYRTPYTTKGAYFRPYGVEYHELRPDIHQTRGMQCIDCHSGSELMGTGVEKARCSGCHLREEVMDSTNEQLQATEEGYIFIDRKGKSHKLPLLSHPAHFSQKTAVACQACHAQWSFRDQGRHFLRTDSDDLDMWYNLPVQGSLEVERIIENNTDYDKQELPVQMADKLTGEQYPGIWIKGFTLRRWEGVQLGLDPNGTVTVVRPLLDYHLSWIDDEETTRFDAESPGEGTSLLRPYVPHTTGPAGLFYQDRLDRAVSKAGKSGNTP